MAPAAPTHEHRVRPEAQPVGRSPQAQVSLHSQCPRLFPNWTLVLGRHPHLESNESELFLLLSTGESPLPEGTPTPGEHREEHWWPRGHAGSTCTRGEGAGRRQRLGLWERCQSEAWASPAGRRPSAGLEGERQRRGLTNLCRPAVSLQNPQRWPPPATCRWGLLPKLLHAAPLGNKPK